MSHCCYWVKSECSICCDCSVTRVVHLVSCSLLKHVAVYDPDTDLGVHMLPVLPFVTSLRTRLLALHLLEVVLPSSGNEADRQHLQQVSVASVASVATVASLVLVTSLCEFKI